MVGMLDKLEIQQFDGKNVHDWKFRVLSVSDQ